MHLNTVTHGGRENAMKIDERNVGDIVVLDMQGKLLIGEGDEILREKINALVESGKTKIVLNLGEVPYMDSAGLGEVVRCYTTVSRKNGKLKLVNLTKRLQDLLSITKLLTVFETYENEDDAKQALIDYIRDDDIDNYCRTWEDLISAEELD